MTSTAVSLLARVILPRVLRAHLPRVEQSLVLLEWRPRHDLPARACHHRKRHAEPVL